MDPTVYLRAWYYPAPRDSNAYWIAITLFAITRLPSVYRISDSRIITNLSLALINEYSSRAERFFLVLSCIRMSDKDARRINDSSFVFVPLIWIISHYFMTLFSRFSFNVHVMHITHLSSLNRFSWLHWRFMDAHPVSACFSISSCRFIAYRKDTYAFGYLIDSTKNDCFYKKALKRLLINNNTLKTYVALACLFIYSYWKKCTLFYFPASNFCYVALELWTIKI